MSQRSRFVPLAASAGLCLAVAFVPTLAQQPAPARQTNFAAEAALLKDIEKIKDEGLNRSEVMKTVEYLSDVIGPRLTASPNMKRANEWTRDKMTEFGLKNAHLEPWGPFGKGWSLKKFSAQIVEPDCIPLVAFPKAWSPGTDGEIKAEVVTLDVKTEADFAKYKGKLKGKVVLVGAEKPLKAHFEADATRRTDKQLLDLADADSAIGARRGRPFDVTKKAADPAKKADEPAAKKALAPAEDINARMAEFMAQREVARKRLSFMIEEGVAATLEPSSHGDFGTLFVMSATVPSTGQPGGGGFGGPSPYAKDAPKTLPQIVLSIEHHNRLVRLLAAKQTLTLALDLKVEFHDKDLMGYNTIAEIPGSDPKLKDEIVMLGGHMDSWHGGTGATDNAAGCAVAMEAVRIIMKSGLKPRRTIRVGLWSGEEQGLLGSAAYVKQHFGYSDRAGRGMGGGMGMFGPGGGELPKITTKPEYDLISGYFNYDNGTGKIRGIYLQGNDQVGPIFRRWLQPFKDLGAQTVTIANTGGTDHQSFDAIGIPGFQFIQDEIEYEIRTHHSTQDVYDRLQADDLKQSATVMAAFVYQTAQREEKLPRKPTGPKSPEPAKTASTR